MFSFLQQRTSITRRSFSIALFIFLALAAITVTVGLFYYGLVKQGLTLDVYRHRETVASLSASAIKLKLDRLTGVAKSLAAQDAIKIKIVEGRWSSAVADAKNLSNEVDFYDSYIDRILLVDTSGKVRAAYPELYGGINESDITFDEWSLLFRQGQETSYVSNVYKRRATPRINVVEVVAPVVEHSSVVGFIALQIPLNNFSDFGKDIDLGSNGFAYFVDRKGQIIIHPKFSSDGPIIDYSSVPTVQKLLRGEKGSWISYNPIENTDRVSAYELVPTYGWGVISVDPVADAFAARDSILNQIALLIFVVCAGEFFATLLVLMVTRNFKKNEPYAR